MTSRDYEIPHDDFIPAESIRRGADLSGGNLARADLPEADLRGANLSEVDLRGANLSGANLRNADLSGANPRGANLSGANLRNADLSGANLRHADLSGTLLAETEFHNVALSRRSDISPPDDQIDRYFTEEGDSREDINDRIARANHELREAYSNNGLLSRARSARFRERKARRREAFAEGGRGRLAWASSVLSMCFTGYGVRLRYVVLSMLASVPHKASSASCF